MITAYRSSDGGAVLWPVDGRLLARVLRAARFLAVRTSPRLPTVASGAVGMPSRVDGATARGWGGNGAHATALLAHELPSSPGSAGDARMTTGCWWWRPGNGWRCRRRRRGRTSKPRHV